MDFEKLYDFVMKFSKNKKIEPVIMFTGKRDLPDKEKENLNKVGKFLSDNFPEAIFRAGNQTGADKEFVKDIPPERLQIFPPYSGHRKGNIPEGAEVYPLDKIFIPAAAETFFKRKEPGLYKAYKSGKGREFEKSRYLLRNLAMIYGFKKDGITHPQASLTIYWDDMRNSKSGGTGFTVEACKNKGVSPLSQKIWLKWIKQ